MHPDWSTLALQTINVLVLVWLLRRFFFRPVADIIAARRRAAEALLAEAAAKRAEAQASAEELARRAAAGADEADQVRARAVAEAAIERAKLIAEAEAEIARLRAEAAASLLRDRASRRESLEAEGRALALAIARRLLAGLPGPAVTAAILARLDSELATLPAEQLRALSGPLEVASAAPLGAEEQASCAALLARRLGSAVTPRFVVDPALLTGVELRGRHAVLRRSWQADLERISTELAQDSRDAAPLVA
ncbi:MAG: F0F1 ATP synthase subunit delta [Rhodospirillales bacterium]|nr:F0F1 ATP synthase subunit delta [Rhodospirillales bacterium]